MYGKSSLESNWPEPWSFVGGSWRRGARRGAAHGAAGSSIGDGSSWISRIRGGAATLWVAPRPHRLCALKTEEQKCLNYEERRAAEQN